MSSVPQLKMRAGGMSESSKWKKQKRSPRAPHLMVRSPSGTTEAAQSSSFSNNNLSGTTTRPSQLLGVGALCPERRGVSPRTGGGVPFIEQGSSSSSSSSSLPASDSAASSVSSPTTDSGLDTCSKATSREDLSDLEPCGLSAASLSPAAGAPGTEPGSPDAQVRARTCPCILWRMSPFMMAAGFSPFVSRLKAEGLSRPRWSPYRRSWRIRTRSVNSHSTPRSTTWTMSTPEVSASPSPHKETVRETSTYTHQWSAVVSPQRLHGDQRSKPELVSLETWPQR